MCEYDIIIVGAGASGLIAAIEAHSRKDKICILEKKERAGKKLEISGKGRCNITNDVNFEEFLSNFGRKGRFLRTAFSNFFNEDLLQYFNDLGVKFKLERGGRYFPESNNSNEIVNALLNKIKELNIPILTNSPVKNIEKKDEKFIIHTDNKIYSAKKLLIATGGKSYPATGSDGDGYKFAKKFGHKIITPLPSLVPLKVEGSFPKILKDIKLKNVSASLWVEKNGIKKKVSEEFGEMEFKSYGVSGAIILKLSKNAVEYLENGFSVSIIIDFKPSLDHKKIENRILREVENTPNKTFGFLISKLLPQKFVSVFSDILKISQNKVLNQLRKDERKNLRLLLKEFELKISDYLSFNIAIVTKGGVDTREINPKTMESKIVKNLFFAGEIIDVDAKTGGFNLQSAFSTGYTAGQSMKNN